MVGDGESETGPLATSWHSNKFVNPITDGAVLPVQMGLNALLTSLKLNYAAKGSPECARYRARIDEPPKMLRRSAVAPPEVSV